MSEKSRPCVQRASGCLLHRPPGRTLPAQDLADARPPQMVTVEEGRPPSVLVAGEGQVVAPPRYRAHDQADPDAILSSPPGLNLGIKGLAYLPRERLRVEGLLEERRLRPEDPAVDEVGVGERGRHVEDSRVGPNAALALGQLRTGEPHENAQNLRHSGYIVLGL